MDKNISKIEKQEYLDYMSELKNSIFKILPLYEEKVTTLSTYIDVVIFEVYYVRKITPEYDGAWLVQTHALLEGLRDECKIEDNKYSVKSKVLGLLNTIDKQIKSIKEAE